MARLELGVLVSGRGTNLQAILDAIAAGRLDARVRVVVSNRPDAAALARAEAASVPTRVIPHGAFPDRAAFDAALVEALREAGAEWVVLAGFMRLLTPVLLDAFPHRVVNVHPSLLPAFPGVDAQAQALAYGVRVTGCTVHLVDAGTDTGPILAQAAVPVLDGDTRDTLADRILVHEHELLVGTLASIAAGGLVVEPALTPAGRPRIRLVGLEQGGEPGDARADGRAGGALGLEPRPLEPAR
jgi:phosphoribosylglycinamide formyltransferase-1